MSRSINPEVVKAQIAGLLVRYPELQDDHEALVLSLESETDLTALVEQYLVRLQEIQTLLKGLTLHMNALGSRHESYDRREEAMRELILRLMEAAGTPKLELPTGTLYTSRGRPSVKITDEGAIPDIYMRIKKIPDKTMIKEALTAGNVVPGAHLSNAEPHLTIR
jgi:Siphovirus Gp157